MISKVTGIVLCVLGLAFIGYILAVEYNRIPVVREEPPLIFREESSSETPVEPPPDVATEPPPVNTYPVDKLIIIEAREHYVDGDMTLRIPRLELDAPVYNGVDDDTLKKGIGLFDYSQLPGPLEQNGNVSLAGHRDIHGNEFYYIDTVTDGDLIYLDYQGIQYTYLYETTFITDPYDWNPIRVKDYPCITLQSCEPIGIANQRIFVVGRLIDVSPLDAAAAEPDNAAPADPFAITPEPDNPAADQEAQSDAEPAPGQDSPGIANIPNPQGDENILPDADPGAVGI